MFYTQKQQIKADALRYTAINTFFILQTEENTEEHYYRWTVCFLRCLYQGVAELGEVDELVIGRRAHVESDGEHLLQSSHDQRGLHGVTVPAPLLLGTFYVRAASLGQRLQKTQDIKHEKRKHRKTYISKTLKKLQDS